MARAKKKGIANISLEEAQAAGSLYVVNSNELKKIEAKMNEEINRVRDKYQGRITEMETSLAEPLEVLEAFANEQKEIWGRKKSRELLHCTIGFRTGRPKVIKDKKFSWEAVLEMLKKSSLFKRFIRTSLEVNREAILAEKNREVLHKLKDECYVEVVQEETFYVEPKTEGVTT